MPDEQKTWLVQQLDSLIKSVGVPGAMGIMVLVGVYQMMMTGGATVATALDRHVAKLVERQIEFTTNIEARQEKILEQQANMISMQTKVLEISLENQQDLRALLNNVKAKVKEMHEG